MQRKTLLHEECPIARSLERVGEWWSILIMRDALHGLRRFEEFSRSLEIAPNMLTRRLNSLVEAGLLERQAYSQRPLRYQYVPTARGEDFRVVLMAFVAWGNRHYAPEGESVQIVERASGRPVRPMMADLVDGRPVPLEECTVQVGPMASEGMRQRLGACRRWRPSARPEVPRIAAATGACHWPFSQLTIHEAPKRSTSMPKRAAQKVASNGIWTVPWSASAANTRSASAMLSTFSDIEQPWIPE